MSRRSGFRIAIRPSKSMASVIRPAWRIWRATRLSRSSTVRTICPSASSFGWERRSIWPRAIADFAASTLARKKRELGKAARSPSGRADRLRSRAGTASQNRTRARPASHLLRLSRRGRRHQQWLGAKTPPLRDPAKGHKRLPRHVGRRSRGGRANNRRHRAPQRRQSLRRHPRHPRPDPTALRDTAPQVRKGVGNCVGDTACPYGSPADARPRTDRVATPPTTSAPTSGRPIVAAGEAATATASAERSSRPPPSLHNGPRETATESSGDRPPRLAPRSIGATPVPGSRRSRPDEELAFEPPARRRRACFRRR